MGEWGSPDRPRGGSSEGPPPSGPVRPGDPPDGAPSPSGPSLDGHPPPATPAETPADAHPTAGDNGGSASDGQGSADQVGDESSEGVDDQIKEPSAAPTRRGAREMAKVLKERDEYLDQLKRTRADFENYRKRISRQQMENLERASEGLVEKILPVLDNFDAALAHGEGFEQVHTSFVGLLNQEGLVRIDPKDQPFDPNEAEAVAHEDGEDGPVVAEVLRPGYKWKGRVLRPAMVRVRG